MYQALLAPPNEKKSSSERVKILQLAGVITLVVAASGCGNRGDLYLPEDTATTYQATTHQTTGEQGQTGF